MLLRHTAAPPPQGAASANGFCSFLLLFYSFPDPSLETRSGTLTRMSGSLPKTNGAGNLAAERGNPDNLLRQSKRAAQCLKLPEPPEATGGKEKPSGQKWKRMKKRCPCGVGAPPQLPVKVGNQKKDVNPKCEEKNYKISGF